MMKALLFPLLGLALAVGTIPAEGLAQTLPPAWQSRPGALAIDAQRYRADQNRFEMERLRLGADQRRLEAQLGQVETERTGIGSWGPGNPNLSSRSLSPPCARPIRNAPHGRQPNSGDERVAPQSVRSTPGWTDPFPKRDRPASLP